MRRLLGAAFVIAGLSGVAVAFAGLFTDLSSAPVEPSDVRAENSGSGSDLFVLPHPISVDDSHQVAQVNEIGAQHTPLPRSVNDLPSDGYNDSMGLSPAIANSTVLLEALRQPEQPYNVAYFLPTDADKTYGIRNNYSRDSVYAGYFNIPPTIRSNINDSFPIGDPLHIPDASDKANNNIDKSVTNLRPAAHDSKLAMAPRALRSSGPKRSTRRPEVGCSRCVGHLAQSYSGRTKSLAALFSANALRNGRSIRQEPLPRGNIRQSEDNLLATRSTSPRDSWKRAL
jgi:hypothetical protein